MRVLVVGATGFLGGAVALRLLRDGHESWRSRAMPPRPSLGAGRARRSRRARSTMPPELKRAIADADAVINAADSDHAAGIAAILEAIAGTGKTFIHTSGISVTGRPRGRRRRRHDRDEYTPYEPIPERAARYAIDAQ